MAYYVVTSEEIKQLVVVSMEYALAKRRDNPNFFALRNIQRQVKRRKIPEGFKYVADIRISEEGGFTKVIPLQYVPIERLQDIAHLKDTDP